MIAEMNDSRLTTLEAELAALEAAIPFLRQSMSPEQFAWEVRQCCKDIMASAQTEAEISYARLALNDILESAEAPFCD
jgi:hypothetical protein